MVGPGWGSTGKWLCGHLMQCEILSCPLWAYPSLGREQTSFKARAAQEMGAAGPAVLAQRLWRELSQHLRSCSPVSCHRDPSGHGKPCQSTPVPAPRTPPLRLALLPWKGEQPETIRGVGGGTAGSGSSSFEVK